MTKKLPKIIIGIPAFNEEANIGLLLEDIEKQKTDGFIIQQVIVNSDASSDRTEAIAKKSTLLPVTVLTHEARQGLATRLNDIIKIAKTKKTTALVLFDADIRISDPECISKLIQPILLDTADLTSCKLKEVTPVKLIDKALKVSMNIKSDIFERLRDGDNIYTCFGPVRAFSSRMVNTLEFPYSIGNDAYTYLFAKKANLKYQFVRSTFVNYKLPTALADHSNQSLRFLESKKLLAKDFGVKVIQSEYKIPFTLKSSALINYFFQEPTLVMVYLSILTSMKLKYLSNKGMPDTWHQVSSSKSLT